MFMHYLGGVYTYMTKEKVEKQMESIINCLNSIKVSYEIKNWKLENNKTGEVRKGKVIIINNYNKLDKNQKFFVRNLDFRQHIGKYKSFWEIG